VRLVVVHHPLDWLAEFDATAVRALLERSGVFVLSGHEHTVDPAAEMTSRGAALYSRAGCLYAGYEFANGYTILDLDAASHIVQVTMRRWWPKREEFDVATDLHRAGSFSLPWPARRASLAPVITSFAEVLSPLAKIAHEQSLIAASLAIDDKATVSDLLIEPRFWSVPKREAIDSTVPRAQRPKPVSAIDAVNNSRVVVVSGEASAGVTSALLWILEEHFGRYGTLAPSYVQADERLRASNGMSVVGVCGR
jgi:hypothetical protein